MSLKSAIDRGVFADVAVRERVVVERPDVPVPDHDPVDHPAHYTGHPSGVECITITEHMGFCLGNAVKYIWRADLKHSAIEDLRKARWYLDRELARRVAVAERDVLASARGEAP